MATIINFTQHNATEEQVAAGVIDSIPAQVRAEVLTFSSLPTVEEIWSRADKAVGLITPHVEPGTQVMIGGAPFFMGRNPRFVGQVFRHYHFQNFLYFCVVIPDLWGKSSDTTGKKKRCHIACRNPRFVGQVFRRVVVVKSEKPAPS